MLRKILDFPIWEVPIKAWIVILVISIPLYMLFNRIEDAFTEHRLKEASEKREERIQAEVQRRRAKRDKTDNGSVSTPHVSPIAPVDSTNPSTEETSTEFTHVADIPQKSSESPSRLLIAGPYKGMTPEEAQKHEQRIREHDRRLAAFSENLDKATNLLLKTVDDEELLMLSLFKSFSPEQLKNVREELLKTQPAAEVNSFFDDINNKGIAKTEEQLVKDAEAILSSRAALLDVVFRELDIEWAEIDQEYNELYDDDE